MTYMARLGDYQFSIDTAAFKEYQRVSSYRWEEKKRIGRDSALQFTGVDAETLTLSGTIYPHYRGGMGQVAAMRAQAGQGVPLPLIYSSEFAGQLLGRWCIVSCSEGRTIFMQGGLPKRIEFQLSLKKYGEDGLGLSLAALADPLGSTSSFASQLSNLDPTGTLAKINAQVGSLQSQAGLIDSLTSAVGLGTIAGDVVSNVAAGVESFSGALLNSSAGQLLQTGIAQVGQIKEVAENLKAAAGVVRAAGSDPLAMASAVAGLAGAAQSASGVFGASASAVLSSAGLANGSSAASLLSAQASAAAGTLAEFADTMSSIQGVSAVVVSAIEGYLP